jgi:formylglycine-generating enzyme required for sulfatase activity
MKRAAPIVLGSLLAATAAIACSDSGSGAAQSDGGPDPTHDGGATDGPEGTDGGSSDGGGAGGDGGGPKPGSSCEKLPTTCGGSKDCCASSLVPGGTFNRSSDPAFPATVSDFKLDVYEVTVGRFRNFVNAGKGTQADPPAPGSGAHPKIPSSGWDPAFNANLAADTAALKSELKCTPDYPAWSDAPGPNDTKPMNCVTWFEAFAFCAWDGGRLPTETEWNYAAAGGNEQREYPWGAGIDLGKAAYDCAADGSGAGACAFGDMLPVGSKSPQGDGKWGHADLAGNVWEWTLDYARDPYRLKTCTDCADLQAAPHRTFRGGGFPNERFYLTTATRIDDVPTDRDYDVGFRCARAPTP